MASVEFEPRSFDAAIAFFSLINLPLPEQSVVIERVAGWLVPGGRLLAIVGKLASTRIERNFRGVTGAAMYWSHADVKTYRDWFEQAGFVIEEEGSEPRTGSPGYAVLIGRRDEEGGEESLRGAPEDSVPPGCQPARDQRSSTTVFAPAETFARAPAPRASDSKTVVSVPS